MKKMFNIMLFSIFYNREINGIFKIGLNVFCFLYLTNSNSDFDIREKRGGNHLATR